MIKNYKRYKILDKCNKIVEINIKINVPSDILDIQIIKSFS